MPGLNMPISAHSRESSGICVGPESDSVPRAVNGGLPARISDGLMTARGRERPTNVRHRLPHGQCPPVADFLRTSTS
jgi:hypothetical protein